jgi:hypothetical protein
MTTKKVIIKR